jgi:hypothetical protein
MLKALDLDLKTKQNNNSIEMNVVKETLNNFKNEFYLLTQIKVGDKIGKNNNSYFIQEKGYFQKIMRVWHQEDRKKTFTYLHDDITRFLKFCNDAKEKVALFKAESCGIKKSLIDFLNELVSGLYNLKLTYKNETNEDAKKLICKIDSIILIFIDLKDELGETTNNKNCMAYPTDIIKKISGEIETMLSVSI